jgi:hypothetical protein
VRSSHRLPAFQVGEEGVERMVSELNQQAAKRQEYSRRRAARADADVDFINERNAHFNKKIEVGRSLRIDELRQPSRVCAAVRWGRSFSRSLSTRLERGWEGGWGSAGATVRTSSTPPHSRRLIGPSRHLLFPSHTQP